ncbi:MAG: dethiobiotin synthase [Candidatus Cloacimonadota bacterium]|nr:MAG: dethiobiotin synthase [Candidatus Cloacimonadota bacterium]
MGKIIFVTGTDTDVGKSYVSLLLMQYFYKTGKKPFYLKPFQTGCKNAFDKYSDAKTIYENVKELKGQNPENSVLNCFRNPKAPLFAARDDNLKINYEETLKKIKTLSRKHELIIAEGAGGLLVPIDEKHFMIDLIKDLQPRIVLTGRAGLGTQNHTLLSVRELISNNLKPAKIIFNDINGTDEQMIRENIETVKIFSGFDVAGIIFKTDNFKNPDYEYLKTFRFEDLLN